MYVVRLCVLVVILFFSSSNANASNHRQLTTHTGFKKNPVKVLRSGRHHSSRFVHAVISMPYGKLQVNVSATFHACKNANCSDFTEVGFVKNLFDHSNPRVELKNVFANVFEITYEMPRPYTTVKTILQTNAYTTSELHLACRAGTIPNGNSCEPCLQNQAQNKNLCEACPENYTSPTGSWHCLEKGISDDQIVGNLTAIFTDIREEFFYETDREMTIDEENLAIQGWLAPVETSSRTEEVLCDSDPADDLPTKKKKRRREENILNILRTTRSDFDIREIRFREKIKRNTVPVDFSPKMIQVARKRGIIDLVRQPGEMNKHIDEMCEIDTTHENCCSGKFNDSVPEVFVLDTGDEDGSWAVLCDAENNPKVKITLHRAFNYFTMTNGCYRIFDVRCWDNVKWGLETRIREDNEYICDGRTYYIGSVSTVPPLPDDSVSIDSFENNRNQHCSNLSLEWEYLDCCEQFTGSSCAEIEAEFHTHACCESFSSEL